MLIPDELAAVENDPLLHNILWPPGEVQDKHGTGYRTNVWPYHPQPTEVIEELLVVGMLVYRPHAVCLVGENILPHTALLVAVPGRESPQTNSASGARDEVWRNTDGAQTTIVNPVSVLAIPEFPLPRRMHRERLVRLDAEQGLCSSDMVPHCPETRQEVPADVIEVGVPELVLVDLASTVVKGHREVDSVVWDQVRIGLIHAPHKDPVTGAYKGRNQANEGAVG